MSWLMVNTRVGYLTLDYTFVSMLYLPTILDPFS